MNIGRCLIVLSSYGIVEWAVIGYLIAVNFISFVMMGRDKRKAKRNQRRTPEKNLFVIALLGGSLGVFLAMRLYRHKTKHTSFLIGIPLLFVLNAAALYVFFVLR